MYVQVAPPHHTRRIPFRLASEVEESAINSAYNTARENFRERPGAPAADVSAGAVEQETEQQASVLLFLEDFLLVALCKIRGAPPPHVSRWRRVSGVRLVLTIDGFLRKM